MNKKVATTAQARRFLLLLSLILVSLTLASLFVDIYSIDTQYEQLAAEVSRSFYRSINTMREWNLDHGGIYVRVAEDIPQSWIMLEQYIQERTDAEFTHGLCPDCSSELYPELFPK
jgi:hypothetical protein